VFFGAVGEKAEVTDTHETIGEHVEERTADEIVSIKGQSLFSIAIFSIPVAEAHLAVFDGEDAVIGRRSTAGARPRGLGAWPDRYC